MSTPWTPGPWRVEQGTLLVWGACDPDDSSSYGMGYPVCVGCQPAAWAKNDKPMPEKQAANARLIAAAPEMAELIEELFDDHFATWMAARAEVDGRNRAEALFEGEESTQKARALLARIKGETP